MYLPGDRQVDLVPHDLLPVFEGSPMRSGVRPNPAIVPGALVVAGHLQDEVVDLDNVRVLVDNKMRSWQNSCLVSAYLLSKLVRGTVDADDEIPATNFVAAGHLLQHRLWLRVFTATTAATILGAILCLKASVISSRRWARSVAHHEVLSGEHHEFLCSPPHRALRDDINDERHCHGG
jgi:hypothetical protein